MIGEDERNSSENGGVRWLFTVFPGECGQCGIRNKVVSEILRGICLADFRAFRFIWFGFFFKCIFWLISYVISLFSR